MWKLIVMPIGRFVRRHQRGWRPYKIKIISIKEEVLYYVATNEKTDEKRKRFDVD